MIIYEYICLRDAFLELKMGIVEMGFIFSLRFRCNFFRHTDFLRFKISKFFFKKIQILGIIEKRIVCFLVYLFLEVFFIESAKRMCICDYVKNRIGTCKKCVFWCEKGYKQIIALSSPKTYCFCDALLFITKPP